MIKWLKQLWNAQDDINKAREQKLQAIRNWCGSCELKMNDNNLYYLKTKGSVARHPRSSGLLALSGYRYYYISGDVLIDNVFEDTKRVVWQACCVLDIENNDK